MKMSPVFSYLQYADSFYVNCGLSSVRCIQITTSRVQASNRAPTSTQSDLGLRDTRTTVKDSVSAPDAVSAMLPNRLNDEPWQSIQGSA